MINRCPIEPLGHVYNWRTDRKGKDLDFEHKSKKASGWGLLGINFPKELNQTFHRDTNISLKKENKAWTALTREKRAEDQHRRKGRRERGTWRHTNPQSNHD